jgi:hypothetical protein
MLQHVDLHVALLASAVLIATGTMPPSGTASVGEVSSCQISKTNPSTLGADFLTAVSASACSAFGTSTCTPTTGGSGAPALHDDDGGGKCSLPL